MTLLPDVKQKNIVIELVQIFVIWFFVEICVFYTFFARKRELFPSLDAGVLFVIFLPLVTLLLVLLCYSPCFLLIWAAFKKILLKKKRILFLLVLAPVYTIFLNYFILHKFGLFLFFFYPVKIFLRLCYFVFIRSAFITLLVIPKKIFHLKWESLLLFATTFIFVKFFYYLSKILFH